jgi:hypothetical protein
MREAATPLHHTRDYQQHCGLSRPEGVMKTWNIQLVPKCGHTDLICTNCTSGLKIEWIVIMHAWRSCVCASEMVEEKRKMKDLRFSRRWLWRMGSSGMLRPRGSCMNRRFGGT